MWGEVTVASDVVFCAAVEIVWSRSSQAPEQCAAVVGSMPLAGIVSQQAIAQCGRAAMTSANTRRALNPRVNCAAVKMRDISITMDHRAPGRCDITNNSWCDVTVGTPLVYVIDGLRVRVLPALPRLITTAAAECRSRRMAWNGITVSYKHRDPEYRRYVEFTSWRPR